jgi:hypothetical protein
MSDVEVRRNAPIIPSSPHPGSTEFVVDYPLPEGEGGRAPHVEAAAADLAYSAREKPARRLVRRLRVPALVLLASALAATLAPRSLRHLQILRLTSACLHHRQPADTVVFEHAPYGLSTRPADPRYQGDRYSLSLVSPEWRALYTLKHGSSFKSQGTAYLGRRSARGSTVDRLVVVDVVQEAFHDSPVQFVWRLYDPGTIRSGPSAVAFGTRNVPGTRRLSPSGVRVFAAIPDLNDESHFTIDVEMIHQRRDGDKWVPQTKRHSFDGWVREKDVLLVPRDLLEPESRTPFTPHELLDKSRSF